MLDEKTKQDEVQWPSVRVRRLKRKESFPGVVSIALRFPLLSCSFTPLCFCHAESDRHNNRQYNTIITAEPWTTEEKRKPMCAHGRADMSACVPDRGAKLLRFRLPPDSLYLAGAKKKGGVGH